MLTRDNAEPSHRFQTPLLNVTSRQCRFIVSESTRDAICCGSPTSETSSWCPWHEQVVFTPRLSERDRQRALSHARMIGARVTRQLRRAA
jgi:hypothetical protein